MRIALTIGFCVALFISCNREDRSDYFPGRLEFPVHPNLGAKEAMAARVVPHPRQLEWQKLEMTAFIHFGVNTFTDREWGTGDESPMLFNPTSLNAEQWVTVLKEAGMKMVIITAKHHDGFCLWPTKTTDHSVASSPWKGGNGDVIRELKDACDKQGMKFGVYLSPWDRNADSYGDSPAYNRFYLEQLTELLTWYGKVDEVWFDGANGEGPDGRRQEYDWQAYYDLIRKLQPDAVTAVMGEDVRWVGTESGYGRETEWSVTALAPGGTEASRAINEALGLTPMSGDLGSSTLLREAENVYWYPAEVDVSIRPGWFWHAAEDSLVKDAGKLADIYLSSVGRNAVLLLNVPPDNRGLITDYDINSLRGLKEWIDSLYLTDLLNGARPYGRGASGAIDGDNLTSWSPRRDRVASFVPAIAATFNVAMLQEDISRGQRVEKFVIEAMSGSTWDTIAEGTTIGYKRLIRFPEVKADEIRLTIVSSRADPHISTFALYRAK
ncbi:alpha-1,3/4-fucosidase [bacterium]|nr:alpha-1,3/4-fucosidase [bacterium]